MTIKRPIKASAADAASTTGENPTVSNLSAPPPTSGGAAIADRFKLDLDDPNAKKAAGPAGISTKIAVLAAVIALSVAGVLTFMLYQHWEFLKGA